jgi:hypothetical protein
MSFSTAIRDELLALTAVAGELADLLAALENAERQYGAQIVGPFPAAHALICIHKARRQLVRCGEFLAAAGPAPK